MICDRLLRSSLLSGWVLGAFLLAAPCFAAPVLKLSRISIDFGAIGAGTKSAVQPVFVYNAGDAPLTVSALTLSGAQASEFAIAGTCTVPITVAPGGQCQIDTTVTAANNIPQARNATLTVVSNATSTSVPIGLTVVVLNDIVSGMQASPAYVDFGSQLFATSAGTRTLTLTNPEGVAGAVIESVALVGGDTQDFTMTSNCVGKTLSTGQSCTAAIGFVPAALGLRATEFELDFHPTDNPVRHFHYFFSVSGSGSNTSTPNTLNINQQGLTGSWYQAATSGQGFEIEVFKDLSGPGVGFMQGSWFTFDAATSGGADHNRWYTFGGAVTSGRNSATLPLYQNVGGNFNAPPVTSALQVGNTTITFTDCSNAVFNYAFTDGSNRSGTIPLVRLTPNVVCATAESTSGASDFGLSGNWYDPARSGQGFLVDVNPVVHVVFFAWYTYAIAGQAQGASGQRWFTGQGNFAAGARSSSVTLYETTGGLFNSTAPTPTTTSVGTGTLTFTSCSAARLTYIFTAGSSSGQSGGIDLVRIGSVPTNCVF